MKRIILFVCFVFIANVFTSCNNEEYVSQTSIAENKDVQNSTINNNLSLLNSQIDSLNMQRTGTLPKECLSTRWSWKKFWSNTICVLWADAKGGVSGLFKKGQNFLSGACEASLAKIIDITEKDVIVKFEQTRSSNNEANTEFYTVSDIIKDNALENSMAYKTENNTLTDSAGVLHNKIILNLFEQHKDLDYWTRLTTLELVQVVNKEVENELNLPEGSLTNDIEANYIMAEEIDNLKKLNTDEDYNAYLEELKENDPNLADLITIITNYINGLVNEGTLDDSKEYSTIIANMINEAEIDENSKIALKTGISIAFASSNLWNTDIFE